MISDPELVRDLLHTAPMPPVPDAPGPGIAWLRASVPRFCDGLVHQRRRAAVRRELDRLNPAVLRIAAAARADQPLAHVRVLLAAMGIPERAVLAVAVVAAAYQPHEPITPEADAAVRELVALCAAPARVSGCTHDSAGVAAAGYVTGSHGTLAGAPHRPARTASAEVGDIATPGRTAAPSGTDRHAPGNGTPASDSETTDDERIAARICILVQACAATGELIAAARVSDIGAPADRPALIMATTPPLRSTRRLVDGVVTELDLRHPGLGFGAGPHRCPGHELAVAIANGILESETPPALFEPGGERPLPGSAPRPSPHLWSGSSGEPTMRTLPDGNLRIEPNAHAEPRTLTEPGHRPARNQPTSSHRPTEPRPAREPDTASIGPGNGRAPTNAHPRTPNPADSTDFHALHEGERPLILPNAWDFTSGALLADAGFPAIATTSLGVAAAAGLPDGKAASATETFALAARLTRLPVLVSVDIEAGFAEDPAEVADYVARLADLGVAGINIEDGRDNTFLATPQEQADLVHTIKTRTPHLFVNARVDTHWFGIDEDSTVHRARLYAAAGADGLFVPGVTDPAMLRTLVAASPLPLNTLYAPTGPDLDTLAALGVRRISTGSALYRAALGAAVGVARTLRGDPGELSAPPDYRRIQALLAAANTA
ncbi:isocitrate lyase/phosphoenolpyruvate mutase family protein [Nocardia sp. NPDC058379]|uniref:isocitrate lyase/PEP mutase family protein n=1 Tax=unclassified Nocardia TaxID=2637762 RepID=UPI003665663F